MTDEIKPEEKQLQKLVGDYQSRQSTLTDTNINLYKGLANTAEKLKNGEITQAEALDHATNPMFGIYNISRDIKPGEDGKGGGNSEHLNDLRSLYGIEEADVGNAINGMMQGKTDGVIGDLEKKVGKNAEKIFLGTFGKNISVDDFINMSNVVGGPMKDYINLDGLKITGIDNGLASLLTSSYVAKQQGRDNSNEVIGALAQNPYLLSDKATKKIAETYKQAA